MINNTCKISINFSSISSKIIFEGYVNSGALSAFIRTSRIYSKFLFKIKNDAKNIIERLYPHVDNNFLTKYIKSKNVNSCIYFVNTTQQLVEKILYDYHVFNDLCNKNFNLVMKEFINANIEHMYTMINLLLMGNEQNMATATLLFNLLKDKKISGETVSDIIYHNLSFHSQLKLKKNNNNMKLELARIKKLTPEHVSIEKRISCLVNMPDSVKKLYNGKIK